MKYNDNGEYKDIYIKTFDTLPIGAIVEYSGATIPDGWTDLGNGKIEKTSQYIEGGTQIASYSTNEVNTGVKWIDGKDIYRTVIQFTTANAYTGTVLSTGISNASNVFIDESHSYVISASDSCTYFINNVRPLSASTLNGDVGSWFRFNPNKSDIFYQVGTLLANSPAVITIEYTKN